MKETIERLARESSTEIWSRFKQCWPELVGDYRQYSNPPALERIISSALIAILTDPAVGFKEALEAVETLNNENSRMICSIYNLATDAKGCTCIFHTAKAKLAELKELSK